MTSYCALVSNNPELTTSDGAIILIIGGTQAASNGLTMLFQQMMSRLCCKRQNQTLQGPENHQSVTTDFVSAVCFECSSTAVKLSGSRSLYCSFWWAWSWQPKYTTWDIGILVSRRSTSFILVVLFSRLRSFYHVPGHLFILKLCQRMGLIIGQSAFSVLDIRFEFRLYYS